MIDGYGWPDSQGNPCFQPNSMMKMIIYIYIYIYIYFKYSHLSSFLENPSHYLWFNNSHIHLCALSSPKWPVKAIAFFYSKNKCSYLQFFTSIFYKVIPLVRGFSWVDSFQRIWYAKSPDWQALSCIWSSVQLQVQSDILSWNLKVESFTIVTHTHSPIIAFCLMDGYWLWVDPFGAVSKTLLDCRI